MDGQASLTILPILYIHVKFFKLKFDHPIYENDTSPFGKGGSRGIFQVNSLLNPPWPPFFKGGNPLLLDYPLRMASASSL